MYQTQAIFLLALSLLVACECADFIKYGYSGKIGPEKWGSLSPSSKLCSKGRKQSPIDIVKDSAVYNRHLKPADREYFPTDAKLINDGMKIQMRFEKSAGDLFLDGKNYSFNEVHWHAPSEHTIDGKRFALEAHLVHLSDDDQIAVVSILHELGNDAAFLIQMKDEMRQLTHDKCGEDEESEIPIKDVQTRSLRRRSRKYFRYVGSLTTPPCTENVQWIILGKIRTVAQEQINALKAPLHHAYWNNARPTQTLNDRKVQLYDELHGRKGSKHQ